MQNQIEIGSCRIRPDLNQLELGQQCFNLRPRTMDLLVFMAERPGQVISIEELLAGVWKDVVVSDNSVHRGISELRRAFAAASAGNPIETIPKRGYRFSIAGEATSTSPSELSEGSIQAAQPERRSGIAFRLLGVTGALLAALLAVAVYVYDPVGGTPSIAVAPFSDLSPERDQQHWADGIALEAWSQLNRIEGLQVSGEDSIYHFRGRDENASSIGETLEVTYVLCGAVSKVGEDLRIDFWLIETSTGAQVWDNTFHLEFEKLSDSWEEIMRSVADAVGIELGVSGWSPYPGMTQDADAFEEFLKATQHIPGRFPEAIKHLERAVDLDSDFGMGWVLLATAYAGISAGAGESAAAARRGQENAIEQALRLIPDSPLVMEHLALMATADRRWSEAGDYYDAARLAWEKHFSGPYANAVYADFLILVGRIDDAIVHLEQARQVNPLDPDIARLLALAYGSSGDADAAREQLQSPLLGQSRSASILSRSPRGGSPTTSGYTLIALASRDPALISSHFGTIPESAVDFDDGMSPWALSRLDEPELAREILRSRAPQLQGPAAATWANFFGDPELALSIYQGVPPGVQALLAFHLWSPDYSEMRKLPGFKDLVTELGLVDYWRETDNWSDFCRPIGPDEFMCGGE
jgi:DNA-binding winged helix-turn-helix (wHTH) protein/TolB-like protein/Flp pilus assembly protein TadD